MRALFLLAFFLILSGCAGQTDPSSRIVNPDPDEVYIYEPGHFEPDSIPGIERLDAAAAQGDVEARYHVAYLRHFLAGDYEAAIPEFRRLAEDDHLKSIKMLAYAYQSGKGVAVDYEASAYWLERAAALGNESAARDLASYRANRK